ncbi:MAG: 30S ribosomal protein S8 [Myxococcales bacterium]|nr:30S ribosomal protein S8 [Myxococcota bacterium]MDW8282176.1 30S ribosomal protein S8 [Myxococcales bacterium]
MSMTDPIADMLTRIRNAIMARKAQIEVPASGLKERIAEILHEEGYLDGVQRTEEGGRAMLTLTLRYGSDNQSAIQSLRRVSRPGQRRYVSCADIPRVRSGLGIAILSTSRGVLTDRQARKLGVGGELLCEVW